MVIRVLFWPNQTICISDSPICLSAVREISALPWLSWSCVYQSLVLCRTTVTNEVSALRQATELLAFVRPASSVMDYFLARLTWTPHAKLTESLQVMQSGCVFNSHPPACVWWSSSIYSSFLSQSKDMHLKIPIVYSSWQTDILLLPPLTLSRISGWRLDERWYGARDQQSEN